MPTVATPKVVRPLRLWVVSIEDSTPGWGLTHTSHFLSTLKPKRLDILAKIDWTEALQVHPGWDDLQRYERQNIVVEVTPATVHEAEQLLKSRGPVHVLKHGQDPKEAL